MLNGRYINSVVNKMIEYKFRGKREDANVWVYGYVFKTRKANPFFDETTWIFNEDGKFKVEPETVGQYIGIDDKNDVEIYEDDIIQTVLDDGSRFSKFIVKWNVNTASFRMIRYQDDSGFKIDTIVLQNKEVIGNIHEQEPHT